MNRREVLVRLLNQQTLVLPEELLPQPAGMGRNAPTLKGEFLELCGKVLESEEDFGRYGLSYTRDVELGRFSPAYPGYKGLIFWVRMVPDDECICSLGYSVGEGSAGGKGVIIKSLGAMEDLTKERMKYATEALSGINPYEFLVGSFLRRLSPVLNAFPEVQVGLSMRYPKHDEGYFLGIKRGQSDVYRMIRDRFFYREDGGGDVTSLDPCKKRVQDILGQNNRWIINRLHS